MIHGIPETVLSEFSAFVAREFGLEFTPSRWSRLARALRSTAEEFGFDQVGPCLLWLTSTRPQRSELDVLASHVTVGETYFFRERHHFDMLRDVLADDLDRRSRTATRPLRIWSVGCSTGEEAYSIAIALHEMGPALPVDRQGLPCWGRTTIVATDVNPKALRTARQGIYSDWSFRGVDARIRDTYFRKLPDGRYEVLLWLRERVTFQSHNLVGDPYPSVLNNTSAMDVIFCRNVLIYFSRAHGERVVQRLAECLTDPGYLILGSADAVTVSPDSLVRIPHTHGTLYRTRTGLPDPLPESQALRAWGVDDGSIVTSPAWPCPDCGGRLPAPVAPPTRQVPPSVRPESPTQPQPVRGHDATDRSPLAEDSVTPHVPPRTDADRIASDPLVAEPHDAQTMAVMARTFADQGRLSDAQAWCEKAVAVDRANPSHRFLLATVHAERGDVAQAIRLHRQALYLDPDFVPSHLCLAALLHGAGQLGASRKHLENAARLLGGHDETDVIPESGGLSARQLIEMIRRRSG